MLAGIHMFAFTDIVPDPKIQYLCGWSLLGLLLFNVTVNFIIIVKGTFSAIKTILKQVRQKYH
jgi:hypothetical protein